jgi:putative membrane protein
MSTAGKIKLVLGAVGLLLVVIIALQNRRPVDIQALFWSARIDLLLLIPLLFVAGVGVGLLWAWGIRRRRGGRPD